MKIDGEQLTSAPGTPLQDTPNGPTISTEELAKKEFFGGWGVFTKSLHNFSKKDLIRVLKYVVIHPIEETEIKFTDAKSERLAILAQHLMVCKLIIQRELLRNEDEENTRIKREQLLKQAETGDNNVRSEEVSESGISVDVQGEERL